MSSAALAADFHGKNIPSRASELAAFPSVAAHAQRAPAGASKTTKCGTAFGAELPTPDGIISWNDTTGSGYDVGGAADFACSAKTKVRQVWVAGYMPGCGRSCLEPFNVTFYQNDSAGGSDEANDGHIVCRYTGLIGTSGGGVEGMVLTQLKLATPCKFKAGKKYWVSVQNNDFSGYPWYWEYSSTLQGSQGDWVDRNNKFGDGCTALDDDRYLVDCLGYTYPDYMLELH